MTDSIQELKRKQARERKQAERERKRAHREAMGAREFRMEMYRATTQALEHICHVGGFEQEAEAITLLLHNVAELAERDPSRFQELLKIRSHA
ncbi:hypothetical protein VQ643_04215 [Pseudomonas sp. F1_0610]|uniref:hypothetical protein n=1 Tax=Pseudomonas sp. F1_0610 TaxID=3114284 RepID=UPI0039C33580